MPKFVVNWNAGVPTTEFDPDFAQGMADRMQTSWFKYGNVADAYPNRVDAIASLQRRLEKYIQTGNTEFLMDVANFAMIEFMRPRHPNAYFKPTDSKESPGRKWVGDVDSSQRANDPKRW
jgi:hypothetical protein